MNILEKPYAQYTEIENDVSRGSLNFQLLPDGGVKMLSKATSPAEEKSMLRFVMWQLVDNHFILNTNFGFYFKFDWVRETPTTIHWQFRKGKRLGQLTLMANRLDLLNNLTKYTNQSHIKQGYLQVGRHTYGTPHLIDPQFGNRVIIGHFCSIGSNIQMMMAYHRTDLVSTYPFQFLNAIWSDEEIVESDHVHKGDIVIGHDVWIGNNAKIMSGVTIGDGAVIAASAVVTKDVEPYSVVGGVPAEHLKYRVESAENRRKLQKIAWWHWPDDKIRANLNKIINPDVQAFIDEFYPQAQTVMSGSLFRR